MTNRLASETSPYLLQHKDNPVEWHPWGGEALARAREEDRPILLSIGYSACHWCHVMERESFEDPEVAEVMNRHFVNVKVDREERPDLDSVYMTAVQSMTGQGGWPLTVFLTPEGIPFYGGTYFPPEPRSGMPSFRQVLEAAAAAYRDRPEEVREAATKLIGALERATTARATTAPTTQPAESGELLETGVSAAVDRYDERNGGFGGAPKFPQSPVLDFLLRRHRDPEALSVVTGSLRAMARGGIRDHLAGGFHRYTVDAKWLVPHFEKMLYDNALLARLYLHHHLLTGDQESRRVAEETLDYLLDDMRSPEGGFYSARDADSEGEEGRYYVWSAAEVEEVLDPADSKLFRTTYDVTPEGNWEGKNILHLPRELEEVARDEGLTREELDHRLAGARRKLLERRRGREAPLRDEKVLAGWNGLALRALAEAGPSLARSDYTEAAVVGATFLLDRMREEDRLLHTWKDGRSRIPGFLDDYASVGNALLTLHETTLDPRWLSGALWCSRRIVDLFWDEEESLFFDTPVDGEQLVVRPRDAMDNPSPSGTSLAIELLLRAAVILDDAELRRIATTALGRDEAMARKHPTAFGALLGCLDFQRSEPVEVAIVAPAEGTPPTAGESRTPGGSRDSDGAKRHRGAARQDDLQEILEVVHGRYRPNKVVVGRKEADADDDRDDLFDDIPLLRGRGVRDGRPTAYVCRNYACREPVSDPEELARILADR